MLPEFHLFRRSFLGCSTQLPGLLKSTDYFQLLLFFRPLFPAVRTCVVRSPSPPPRLGPLRGPPRGAAGAQPRESQELMDQLADDMDELMRALDSHPDGVEPLDGHRSELPDRHA